MRTPGKFIYYGWKRAKESSSTFGNLLERKESGKGTTMQQPMRQEEN